ncbi:unnamed protein product, partial [Didymodactylos carnosus]
KTMFPNVLHKGCLFHFGQCVWRQIQTQGLSMKYQHDEHFRLNVKKLIALAFVPIVDVVEGFVLVAGEFDDDADEVVEYFEKIWIGEQKKRVFAKPMPYLGSASKTELIDEAVEKSHNLLINWNIYERVVDDLTRSNNSVEGWQSAFANRVSISHPTVAKLADKIRREQSKFEVDIAQIRQGHEPKPKKASYRKRDDRIKRLVNAYDTNHLDEYLNSIAANVKL